MEQESIKIHLSDNKFISLRFTELDLDTDLDDITKIHHENIIGEILTVPALLNRVGLMKADVDNAFAQEKLSFEIFESNLRRSKRSTRIANGERPGKDFSKEDIEDEIKTDPVFKDKSLKLLRSQKQCDYMNSIYWSIKDKSGKLDSIKGNLTPQDLENLVIEGTINQILIKVHEKKLHKSK